jgi:hypothetical protein
LQLARIRRRRRQKRGQLLHFVCRIIRTKRNHANKTFTVVGDVGVGRIFLFRAETVGSLLVYAVMRLHPNSQASDLMQRPGRVIDAETDPIGQQGTVRGRIVRPLHEAVDDAYCQLRHLLEMLPITVGVVLVRGSREGAEGEAGHALVETGGRRAHRPGNKNIAARVGPVICTRDQ